TVATTMGTETTTAAMATMMTVTETTTTAATTTMGMETTTAAMAMTTTGTETTTAAIMRSVCRSPYRMAPRVNHRRTTASSPCVEWAAMPPGRLRCAIASAAAPRRATTMFRLQEV